VSGLKAKKKEKKLLFKRYPTLKKAYYHVLQIRALYKHKVRADAQRDLVCWLLKTKEINIKEFNTVANTLNDRLETILNFFEYRNTNANAESFNAKIKLFRANLRGVTNTAFFLYRLEKLYA
jgi:transposase